MEPRQESRSRFRIEKVEERIAPAHIVIGLPEQAVEANNEQAPHVIPILSPGRHGRLK